jgi:L-alanine-DL-glutamate epimerase-like enolase superfamily enzyme
MKVKIKDVKVHVIRTDSPGPTNDGESYMGLLRIISEDGLEGQALVGTNNTDNTRDIVPLTEKLKPFLVGRDALDREWLWHHLRRVAPAWDVHDPSIMAVDVALWDLAAKAADLPLYKLLGAYRDKIPAYATAPFRPGLEANVEDALACKYLNVKGYKVHYAVPDVKDAVEACARVRLALGNDMALMFDSESKYTFQEALHLGRALDEFNFHWYEDPVDPHDLASLAELTRRLDLPVAISDAREFRLADVPAAIANRAARILLGDPKKDGITGMRKMAALCEVHHLKTQFHYGGNTFLNAAVLHVALSVANTDFFPVGLSGSDDHLGLLANPEMDDQGFVHGPQAPGLGVDIDWQLVERFTEAVL